MYIAVQNFFILAGINLILYEMTPSHKDRTRLLLAGGGLGCLVLAVVVIFMDIFG